jgi:hypothetical protein
MILTVSVGRQSADFEGRGQRGLAERAAAPDSTVRRDSERVIGILPDTSLLRDLLGGNVTGRFRGGKRRYDTVRSVNGTSAVELPI